MSSNESNPPEPQTDNSNKINISLLPNIVTPFIPLMTQIYGDLASPSLKKMGSALESVLDSFVTMPLEYLGKKRRINIERNFDMYRKKLENIEDGQIAEVPPELGVPIVQKLGYISSEEIADLFTNLLANASSLKTCSRAHPSFIRIIENLSVDEAKILNHWSLNLLDKRDDSIAFIQFIGNTAKGEHAELSTPLTGMDKDKVLNLLYPDIDHLYMDNLIALGLITVNKEFAIADDKIYTELKELYSDIRNDYEETIKTSEDLKPINEITVREGFYRITDYGKAFIEICTKN
ncbi:hypothetical protein CBE79_27420 [Priestia megaterium]|uniref:DUF4393 domain-containing protein n=3 Tax=Priestia megaterium TaxID=1404 RepID=UPI0011275F93|nr:DUF4393 domain-containing protein [Priestia megaterium]TPF19388.1 hypothetical protein CBE79_27420 [Priestia megaterium]